MCELLLLCVLTLNQVTDYNLSDVLYATIYESIPKNKNEQNQGGESVLAAFLVTPNVNCVEQ